ncbi:hypothetical protein PspMM1_02260 [Pseudoalteromonas sp. MM1]|nr:hypothetical protein PspMM1_02260 [Pseudoalteromonas sp. MM1]
MPTFKQGWGIFKLYYKYFFETDCVISLIIIFKGCVYNEASLHNYLSTDNRGNTHESNDN